MPLDGLLSAGFCGSAEMTEVGFEYVLQVLSGVAEPPHAAGLDSCVPSHEQPLENGKGSDDRGC